MFSRALMLLPLLATTAVNDCGPDGTETPTPSPTASPAVEGDPFASSVVDFSPGEGAGYGEEGFPDVVLGPPEGGGQNSGGLDVLSLGHEGVIVLQLGQPAFDGPGPDIIVFENAFQYGEADDAVFVEPAQVYVSRNGEEWHAFPCSPDAYPYTGCAGISPVLSNSSNGIDPTDPQVAGGDAFDLADLGLDSIQYVRIEDRGNNSEPTSAGFDLDAVAVANN